MTVYFNSDVIDSGSTDFGTGVRINFALAHVINKGPKVHPGQEGDQTFGAGWFSFGADADVIDSTTRTYWAEPVWVNFENFEWHPVPTTDASANDFGVWARRMRWWCSPSTTIWLWIYGV